MRRFYTITLVLALTFSLASAQQITKAKWSNDGSTLDVEYMLKPFKVKSEYSYTIVPMLCSPTDTVYLKPQVWRGAKNVKRLQRDMKLNHLSDVMPYTATKDTTSLHLSETFNTSQYPWIRSNDLTLCFQSTVEGCCHTVFEDASCTTINKYKQPFVPVISMVEDNTGKAGALEKDNPVLQHISKYRPYDDTRVLRHEEGMLYVYFELDKSNLEHDFRNNAETLDRIVQITKEVMEDKTSSVKLIQIIGLASPEGKLERNLQLGGERAEALKKYIQERVETDDSLYEVINGGEAWAELRDQLTEVEFEGRDELIDIIDYQKDLNAREMAMKKLFGGKPYNYLKKNILSDHRNAGYLHVYYDYVPDTAAHIINEANELLQQNKYAEALQKLESVKDDERALNTLGVALYMTGQETEGIECFRKAAAAGNIAAQKNLDQLK